MSDLLIGCQWRLSGPLHAGTGLSRRGYADRLIRRDLRDQAFLPGDAVKGAVRMSAERLLRWLVPTSSPERDDKSLPTHPTLRRIFQPRDCDPFYRFPAARRLAPSDSREHLENLDVDARAVRIEQFEMRSQPFTIAATALDPITRTALDETLRTVEASSRLDRFEVRIEVDGGGWSNPSSSDWKDCRFLCAALLATDSIGGKRGVGYGRISFALPVCSSTVFSFAELALPETVQSIQSDLLAAAAEVEKI